MIAALLLAATFPGNGMYCFGSPAATGELLRFGKDQYVVGISVMLKGRTRAPSRRRTDYGRTVPRRKAVACGNETS